MISLEKKKLLHVGKHELGLTEEQYRDILREHTPGGITSCADPDFTDEDFKRVIDHFKILGFEVKRKFTRKMRLAPDDPPNPEQLKLLDHIWKEFAEFVPNARLWSFKTGFHKRILKGNFWPQTRRECNIVIEAMKVRLRREISHSRFNVQGSRLGSGDVELGTLNSEQSVGMETHGTPTSFLPRSAGEDEGGGSVGMGATEEA